MSTLIFLVFLFSLMSSALGGVTLENQFGSDGIFNSSSIPFYWEQPSSNARIIIDASRETITPPFLISMRGDAPQSIAFQMDRYFTLTGTDSHITQSAIASNLFITPMPGDDAVLTYEVLGVAPSRRCIFSWTNANGDANTKNSAQIKLFESGRWEIHVRDMSSSSVRLTFGLYAYQNDYPWDEWQNYPLKTQAGATVHNVSFLFDRVLVAYCGNGIVEAGEACDGGVCCSSQCQFTTGVCRGSAGLCDIAEVCTGTSALCPADAYAPTSIVCRPKNGSCDVAESCSGTSTSCPADVTITTGTCQEKALSFCGKKQVAAGTIGYYCGLDPGYFYQCSGGVFASQSYLMRCPGGTQCGCPSGVECSCNGLASPCVFIGQTQHC